MMKVAIIVAMDNNRGIGKNNDLMWHLPLDMRFFKETTSGNVVIMGRKNYESIPEKYRPLSDRENVVLTRNTSFQADGCIVFHSLQTCLDFYSLETERTIFIIGGGEIYNEALNLNCVDELYITRVQGNFDADTFFPDFNSGDWNTTNIFHHEKDEKHEVGFTVLKYTKAQPADL